MKVILVVLLIAVLCGVSYTMGNVEQVGAQAPTQSVSENLEELYAGIKEAIRQGFADAIADVQQDEEESPAVAEQATAKPTVAVQAEASSAQADAATPEAAQVADPFDSPYMANYQNTLEYAVPSELRVNANLLEGFRPVKSLVATSLVFPNGYEVSVPSVPGDLKPYRFFPQDDPENPLPVWGTPIASYRDGDNWFCDSPDGWCADAIDAFNWQVYTGLTVCHPAVGCIEDPNGGAVLLLIVNFHDSDEAWDVRNKTAIYTVAGFAGFGKMWDLSGETYDVGVGISAIRNHYLWNLNGNPDYGGQCGSSANCGSVTYVTVARVWDRPELGINFSHYELINYGHFGTAK